MGMTASNWIDLAGLAMTGYMAGKQTAPQPADTSGLNEAARTNAEIGKRQMDLAEKQYADSMALFEEFKPMLTEQIQQSITMQGKSIERSDEAWNFYNDTWKPVEQQLASRSLEMASPGRIAQESERAALETQGQYDAAMTESRRRLQMAGANPEKIAAIEAEGLLAAAKGVGGARGAARRDAENRAIAYLDNAAKFGRNMPSTSLATASLAGQQGQAATGGYGALASAATQPAAVTSNLYGAASNATSSAGSLFSSLASHDLATQISQANAKLGGLGAGVQLYGMLNGGRGD